MRISAALTLAVAAPALAKSSHNIFPARGNVNLRNKQQQQAAPAPIAAAQPIAVPAQAVGATEIIIIWQNAGAGAATTTIQNQVTVTQTVTAGANGAVVGSATIAPGATSVVAGTGATHSVTVGGPGGLAFTPAEIKAAVGDMVVFTFQSNNHSATQSSFATPCDPLAGGMDSGFQPNPDNSVNPPPQVAMQVMVNTPLWFYCKQANHCGQGMTFSINPTTTNTQAIFQAMAIAQRGNGKGSAITGNIAGGNNTVAPPAAAPPAAAAPAVGSAVPAAGAAAGVQAGTGTLQNGQCVCAVALNSAFPAAAAQGLNGFGGTPGALPASMVEA